MKECNEKSELSVILDTITSCCLGNEPALLPRTVSSRGSGARRCRKSSLVLYKVDFCVLTRDDTKKRSTTKLAICFPGSSSFPMSWICLHCTWSNDRNSQEPNKDWLQKLRLLLSLIQKLIESFSYDRVACCFLEEMVSDLYKAKQKKRR